MKKNILSSMIAMAIIGQTATAAVTIDPYPPVSGGSKTPAPNLFVIIDNSKPMVIQGNGEDTPSSGDINILRQVAKGLRTTLKPLIGKVRIGFSTTKRVFASGADGYTCADMKLDGHPGEPASKFGPYGSGWGRLDPHQFDQDYYQYFSGWLGSMCALIRGNEPGTSDLVYYKKQYEYTYPSKYANYYHTGTADSIKYSPISDIYTVVLSLISSKKLLEYNKDPLLLVQSDNPLINRLDEHGQTDTLRWVYDKKRINEPNANTTNGYSHGRLYDAYAPIAADGYPQKDGALECRQNYAIVVTTSPSTGDAFNALTINRSLKSYDLPNGKKYDPGDAGKKYNYMYKTNITDSMLENLYGNNKSDAQFYKRRLSSNTFYAYIHDLRPDLENTVAPYIPNPQPKDGVNGKIPIDWDFENDSATWQHLTTFAVAYTQGMPTWQRVKDAYGSIDNYRKNIENGDIYKLNKEYFWETRGFNFYPLEKKGGAYVLNGKPFFGNDARKELIKAESYIFKKDKNTVNCDSTDVIKNNYTKVSGTTALGISLPSEYEYCRAYVGADYTKGNSGLGYPFNVSVDSYTGLDLLRAGMIGRGGSYAVDNQAAFEKAMQSIVNRIEAAMLQGNTAGSANSATITGQQATPLGVFTTFTDQATHSGNIFSYHYCTAEQQKNDPLKQCGTLEWDAAKRTYSKFPPLLIGTKSGTPVALLQGALKEGNCTACGTTLKNISLPMAQYLVGADTGTSAVKLSGYPARPKIKTYQFTQDDAGVRKPVGLKDTTEPNLIAEMTYASPLPVNNSSTMRLTNPLFSETATQYRQYLRAKTQQDSLVFSTANDGKVYAFKAKDGTPVFQFMPAAIAKTLTEKTLQSAIPRFIGNKLIVQDVYFDAGSPSVSNGWHTLLVGTIRAESTGKDTLFALDLTNYFKTGSVDASALKSWSVTLPGNITATPRIAWIADDKDLGEKNAIDTDGKWVILASSGYNAEDSAGQPDISLLMYDVKNGALLGKANTHAVYEYNKNTASCTLQDEKGKTIGLDPSFKASNFKDCENGLGALTVYDENGDYGADVVFAGDLLGNVWKFRIDYPQVVESKPADEQSFIHVAYAGKPLFTATNAAGQRQAISVPIDITNGAYGEGEMLYFGTGRFFNQSDKSIGNADSFYGIWDNPRHIEMNKPHDLPLTREDLNVNKLKDVLKQEDKGKVIDYDYMADKDGNKIDDYTGFRIMDDAENSGAVLKGCQAFASYNKDKTNITKQTVVVGGSTQIKSCDAQGWVVDFPAATPTERVIDRAVNFEGNVFFMTYEPNEGVTESCSFVQSGGKTRLYALDAMTGAIPKEPPFDFNGDGSRSVAASGETSEDGKTKTGDGVLVKEGNDKSVVSFAGMTLSRGGALGGMVSLLERGVIGGSTTGTCDYKRTVLFPSATNADGKPLELTGCYMNRFKVWKQPVLE